MYNRSLCADSGRVAFFSMKKTLDWLMMVEGLPLGLLMQCYHMLAIFLSDGGWEVDCRFALCLAVISSVSSYQSLFPFSALIEIQLILCDMAQCDFKIVQTAILLNK